MNYFFKVGFRLFKTQAVFYCLNTFGISAGMTGVILLYLFIDNETSYDKFHRNYDRIYRITTVFVQGGQENRFALNEGLWDEILVQDVAGVAYSTAFFAVKDPLNFFVKGNIFSESNGIFSDEDFLKVFDFEILSGVRDFNEPFGIIITRNLAMKYFGTTDVSGKSIEVRMGGEPIILTVSAVLENIPANSSIYFNYVLSGRLYGDWWTQQFEKTNRQGNTLHIYFKTTAKQQIAELQSAVDSAFANHKMQPSTYFTPVQALSDVHFNSTNQFELSPGGNKDYINIFGIIIAGFIFITMVNGININSSYFIKRIKEVGVRKLLGCRPASLSQLFVSDAIVTISIASILSMLICLLIIFNADLTVFSIEPRILTQSGVIFRIGIVSVFLGFLIGLFPAIQAFTIRISNALKGRLTKSREKIYGVRNSVIIIQIVSATIMFALSLIVFRQITYLNTKPLGYNKNNLIYFERQPAISPENWILFKNQLADQKIISSVGACSKPFLSNVNTAQFKIGGVSFLAKWFTVDQQFLQTLGVKLTQGQYFSQRADTIRYQMIVNETARKSLDVDQLIGGELFSWFGDGEIVGIVDDFHFREFSTKISSLVLVMDPKNTPVIYARYEPGKHKEVLLSAQRIWNSFSTGTPLEFHFFDDSFNKMLERELQTRSIVVLFTIISMVITSIGLTGLIGHIATEYRQEIAIRKVLGSSIAQILLIFANRFTYLLVVALIIATPSIKWLSETWLSSFEYKISLQPTDFIVPFIFIIIATIAVVSRQAITSAAESPVKVLRSE